ncbi:MAG: hypothetical protein ACK4WD_05130 [Flavobacteriales bacterium]
MRKLSNHLGNVLANIGDQKLSVMNGEGAFIPYFVSSYSSQVLKPQIPISKFQSPNSSSAPMTERTAVVTPTDVRYGFNSQEKTDEISGSGNHYTAEYWEYDSRLGRRWNLDPMFFKYPWQSPYSAFNNNPIRFSDPLGLEGEDEVAPAGHKEHKGANNGALYLPSSAKVETNQKTQETALVNNPKVKIKAIEGTVRSFTIGEDRYVAAYNSKSGSFMGYRNFQTGAMYQNPEGMRTTGTTAKVGFGETRGLYPSKGWTEVGGDPSTWDYQASQELMSARGAIEVVAKRNTSVHPGATPSTNPNNVEYQQRQFAISENFPDVDPAIANDPTVTNFYNASSPDYIPGNSYVDRRYWNISIVKSYGPFYNASSMGDTQQGVPVYIIFYSVKPKK